MLYSTTTHSKHASMRLALGLSWAISLLVAQSVAYDAYIYIPNASERPSPQSLSPEATRLLLARRLGLSRYHSLEGADEVTLRTLNDFGGKQEALLSVDEQSLGPQRNLVVVEDVENLDGRILRMSTTPSVLIIISDLLDRQTSKPVFTIANIPDSPQTLQLVKDFFEQATGQPEDEKAACSYSFPDGFPISGGVMDRLDRSGVSKHIFCCRRKASAYDY